MKRWTVVMPLKGGPNAKSRLVPTPGLAEAIALDTLEAAIASERVTRILVVTAAHRTAHHAELAGAQVVGESRPGSGLNAAIADGVRAAARFSTPTAVLLADLPALRPEDLTDALLAVEELLQRPDPPRAVAVPDQEGTGTVLLAARRAGSLDAAFGAGSLAEHERRGAVPLELDLPRLRRDVDTESDLEEALLLGCGVRTHATARVDDAVQRFYLEVERETGLKWDSLAMARLVDPSLVPLLPYDDPNYAQRFLADEAEAEERRRLGLPDPWDVPVIE